MTFLNGVLQTDGASANVPQYGGTIHYVSKLNGDDTYNDGLTPSNAFETIGKAIASLSIGDAINIMSGTYTETGLDLNVANCEMWFEIGALLTPASGTVLTVSANYCRVTCEGGALKVTPATNATGVVVTGNFCYLNEIRVTCFNTDEATSADIGFDITGDGCDLRWCRCSSPDVAAFKVQGDKNCFTDCLTGGGTSASPFNSIGFWITNSCGKVRIKNSSSQGHGTAGFQIDAGCTNGVIENFHSGGGDGKCTNAGTDFAIPNFAFDSKLTHTNTLTIAGGVGGAGTTYNIFQIKGAVRVFNILGHVTTVMPATASTVNLELYSTNASVDITDSVGAPDLNGVVVGAILVKDSISTDPLSIGEPNTTPAIIENANYRTPITPIILIEDNGADTYIQVILTAAMASGEIDWHIEWEPDTEGGYVSAV